MLSNNKTKKAPDSAPKELSLEEKKKLRDQNAEPSTKREIIGTPVQEKKVEEIPVKSDQIDSKNIFKVLENLAEGISSISSELGAIRKMMEDDRKGTLERVVRR